MLSNKTRLALVLGATFITPLAMADFGLSPFHLFLGDTPTQQVMITNHVTPGNDSFAPTLSVKLFSSKDPKNPCWSDSVAFKQTEVFNAGPGMGCADIATATISPVNSNAYTGSQTITPSDFATQVMVIQDPNNPPNFDPSTGKVTKAGQILAKVQSGF